PTIEAAAYRASAMPPADTRLRVMSTTSPWRATRNSIGAARSEASRATSLMDGPREPPVPATSYRQHQHGRLEDLHQRPGTVAGGTEQLAHHQRSHGDENDGRERQHQPGGEPEQQSGRGETNDQGD